MGKRQTDMTAKLTSMAKRTIRVLIALNGGSANKLGESFMAEMP